MSVETARATIANFDQLISAAEAAEEAGDGDDPSESPSDGAEGDEGEGSSEPPEPDEGEPEEEAEESAEDEEEGGEDEPEHEAKASPDELLAKLIKSARRTGKASEELIEQIGDLRIEVPLPGGKAEVPIKELTQGYMRTNRFHRELEKTRADQQKAQHVLALENQRNQIWQRDPARLRAGLRYLGCEQSVEHMFWEMAREKGRYLNASPEERQMMDRMRDMEIQNAQAQEQLRAAQLRQQQWERQQQQQTAPDVENVRQMIDANMDSSLTTAFKSVGLAARLTDGVRKHFLEELQLSCSENEDGGCTLDNIRAAAQATAEVFQDARTAHAKATAEEKRKPNREAPPKRAPASAPSDRDSDGRFVAPRRKAKVKPTAAEFRKQFYGE